MEGGQMVQFDGGLGKFHQQNDYHMTCRWTELDLARHTKAYTSHQDIWFWPVSLLSRVSHLSSVSVCV